MARTWAHRLDDWLRRHPRVMLAVVVIVFILVAAVLLGERDARVILYEAF